MAPSRAPDGARADGPPVERQVCAVLGHELRNPLAAAVTDISVAIEMTDRDDPRAAFLSRALDDLDRMARILASCLDWGRGARPRRREVGAGELAAGLAERFVDAAAAVDVDLDPAAATARLLADPALLGRVLDNLVQNAVAVGATSIAVRFAVADDRLAITVDDDGPGLPAALGDTVFDPFVSGRGSSGLGLAIVRDVVEAHDGRVTAVAHGPRGGARFTLDLPLAEAAAWIS